MTGRAAVVLDTSWTPDPADPHAPLPVRLALLEVLDRENVFLTALEVLDRWAAGSDLADRFARDGVTWWFHARSFLRLDVHEMLLWGRIIDIVAPPGAFDEIHVPRDRPLLAEVIRARPAQNRPVVIETDGSRHRSSDRTGKPSVGPTATPVTAPAQPLNRRRLRRSVRSFARSLLVALGLRPPARPQRPPFQRRLERLAETPGALLAIVRGPSFHLVETAGRTIRRDPYVGPVIERLSGDGLPTVTVAIAMGHQKPADRRQLRRDRRMLPASILHGLAGTPSPEDVARDTAEVATRLESMPEVPMPDGDRDLGPAMRVIVRGLAPWLARQWADMAQAGILMDILKPAMLLTGWEAARTAWLGAARQRGIPTVAIQHGVIYPSTPDYCRPEHPALVRPDITCVYGSYDRQILVDQGCYSPDAVIATGSPRVEDRDALPWPLPPEERAAVREALGILDGHRMLVISGARMTVGDRLGTLPLMARVLDGPLPGVHIVVKLHPEERDSGHYAELFAGLARAGGYPAPPVRMVRDMDIYRLLRAADAHLGIFSTVLTDSVLTGTPNMILVGQAQADLLGYVAAGVAVPVRTVDDVRAFMAHPVPPTAEARRLFIDSHYEGGDPIGRIADLIVPAIAGARDQS